MGRSGADQGTRFPYRAGVDTALHGTGLPYGYTITIWSSGAVLSANLGTPRLISILLFTAGAVCGYGGLRLFAGDASELSSLQLSSSPHPVRAGAIHVLAIVAAIGVAALIAELGTELAWGLGGLAATVAYLAASAVELALWEGEKAAEREAPGRRGRTEP